MAGTAVGNSGFQNGPSTCMPATAGDDHMIGQTDLPTTLESFGSDPGLAECLWWFRSRRQWEYFDTVCLDLSTD